MARPRGRPAFQTGALLLLLLCATCLFAGRTAPPDHDTGSHTYGVVYVVKDSITPFTGAAQRTSEHHAAALGDLPTMLTVVAFLLAGAALTVLSGERRRLLLAAVASRAPPGGPALG